MVILKRDDSLWLHVLYGQTGGCVVHHTTNDILHIGCFGLFIRDDRPQRIGTEVILQAPVRWDGEYPSACWQRCCWQAIHSGRNGS